MIKALHRIFKSLLVILVTISLCNVSGFSVYAEETEASSEDATELVEQEQTDKTTQEDSSEAVQEETEKQDVEDEKEVREEVETTADENQAGGGLNNETPENVEEKTETTVEEKTAVQPAKTYNVSKDGAKVTVKTQEATFNEEVKLTVKKVTNKDSLNTFEEKANTVLDTNKVVTKLAVYEISFVSTETNKEVEPSKEVEVTIKLTDQLKDKDAKESAVIHLDDNGTASVVASKDKVSNTFAFSTDSFSEYGVALAVEVDTDDTTIDNDKMITINVKKTWVDEESSSNLLILSSANETEHPAVTLHLMANQKDTGKSIVVSKGTNWEGTFGELPAYDDGKLILYQISEDDVTGYNTICESYESIRDKEISAINGDGNVTINVTNKLIKMNINVTKIWVTKPVTKPEDSHYNNLPTKKAISETEDTTTYPTIKLHLYANDKEIKSVEVNSESATLDESGNWVISFNDLPAYEDGEMIKYNVVEDGIDDYVTVYNYTSKDVEEREVLAIKDAKSKNENGVVNLSIANVLNKKINIDVEKEWVDTEAHYNNLPITKAISETVTTKDHSPVTLRLYENGEPTTQSKVVSKDTNWQCTFESLPTVDKDGYLIEYSVKEDSLENGYVARYESQDAIVDKIYTAITGTNNNVAITVTNVLTKTFNISGQKVWLAKTGLENLSIHTKSTSGYAGGLNSNYGTLLTNEADSSSILKSSSNVPKPDSIKIMLLANGEEKKIITVNASSADENGNWSFSFKNLPVYGEDGKIINYEVKEISELSDYDTIYLTPSSTGSIAILDANDILDAINGNSDVNITIENIYNKAIVTVDKKWVDTDGTTLLTEHPETVKVQLAYINDDGFINLVDKESNSKAIRTLSEDNDWTYTWTGLDPTVKWTVIEPTSYDDNGNPLTGVDENHTNVDELNGYEGNVSVDRENINITKVTFINRWTNEKRVVSGTKTWSSSKEPGNTFTRTKAVVVKKIETRDGKLLSESSNVLPQSAAPASVNDDSSILSLPDSITLRLYYYVDSEDDAVEYDTDVVKPDSDGNWKYEFKECPSYTKDGKSINYEIVEDDIDNYILGNSIDLNGTITNYYYPSIVIKADKVLNNKKLTKGEFEFSLVEVDKNGKKLNVQPKSAETGKTITNAINEADGSIVFDRILYDEEGTHYYKISEVTKDDNDYVYDDESFIVEVTVEKDEVSGLLKASTTKITKVSTGETVTKVEFTNTYLAKVDLTGSKTSNKKLTDGQYNFVVLEDGKEVSKGTNDKNGNIKFDTMTYDKEGIHTYIVKEVNGGQRIKGVNYDNTEYTVVVVVKKDDNGTLTATAVGADCLDFDNNYTLNSTSIHLTATKKLTGGTLIDGQFSFEVIEGKDIVAIGTNDASGKITFNTITYTEAGEHTYTVKEVKGEEEGVTYDETTYTVKVAVTDDSEGNLVAKVTGNDKLEFTNIYNSTSTLNDNEKTIDDTDKTNDITEKTIDDTDKTNDITEKTNEDTVKSIQKPNLVIYKVDQDYNFLAGATFRLVGEGRDETLSTDAKFTFKELADGKYTVTETVVPEGYEGVGSFEIEVRDGVIYYENESLQALEVVNTNNDEEPEINVLGDEVGKLEKAYQQWYKEYIAGNTVNTKKTTAKTTVKTSDETHIMMYTVALAVASIVFIYILRKKKIAKKGNIK